MTQAPAGPARIVPCLRYRNARAAIEWLEQAFGFSAHLVVPGPADTILHAQLTLGNGMIMLGSVLDSDFARNMAQPDEIGHRETQSAYVIVDDADALHARAKAAGATILIEIADADYGGRGFTCRDPEGHVWSFGTYDPWQS
ncbi:PhnB protein [Bordetella ansorpii]|uniref:PhnB protein n=1 Tax=Bordetella ansorpii TaxID=288768 RepID=A0A157SH91_9BORD|nr:VOC family protein [Bordetella ansorpii]SAI69832.1 PhnB protein [Bordetella ansorpii]